MYNIKIMTTAAYSPFSKGTCERHNAIITDTPERVTADFPDFVLDTRLSYVCMAKIKFYNNNGFTPSQVKLGTNQIVPNVLTNT